VNSPLGGAGWPYRFLKSLQTHRVCGDFSDSTTIPDSSGASGPRFEGRARSLKLRFAAEDHCLVRFLIDRAASEVHWARHNSALGPPPIGSTASSLAARWRFGRHGGFGAIAVWGPWAVWRHGRHGCRWRRDRLLSDLHPAPFRPPHSPGADRRRPPHHPLLQPPHCSFAIPPPHTLTSSFPPPSFRMPFSLVP